MSQEYSFNKKIEPKEGAKITRKPDIKDQETMEELRKNFNGHNKLNSEPATEETFQKTTPSYDKINAPEETIGVNLADKLEPLYRELKQKKEISITENIPQEKPSEVETPPLDYKPELSTDTTLPDVETIPEDKIKNINYNPEPNWQAVLQKNYDRKNEPQKPYPSTYEKALENILKERNNPFTEADLNKNTETIPETENLDLSDHIAVETTKKEPLPPEIIEEIKEDLASSGLIENIEKVASRAEEVMAEIESLPDDKKEKVIYGLNTLGYRIDKWKNEKIANILEKSATKLKDPNKNREELRKQDTLTRFLHGLASGRRQKVEQVEKTIDDIQNKQGGLLTSVGNIGRPVGTALKIGRILNDVGAGTPLRSVMLIASGVEEVSRGAKEARLESDAVLRKERERRTGLKWHEKETLRGQDYNEEEINSMSEKIESSLDNTLHGSLTRKMRSYDELKEKRQRLQRVARGISKGNKDINKLDEARLMFSGIAQGVAQWQNKFWLDRVQKKLTNIEKNESLTNTQKDQKKEKLFASYENKLTEMERMISGYGTIDVLAMAAKNVETASKGVVLAMMADTLYKTGAHVYNFALDKSEYFEGILEQDKNTPDDLEPDVLPEGPIRYPADKGTESDPISNIIKDITGQESSDDVPPIPYRPDANLEDIKDKAPISRLALFENTGADVITDPYGKVSVVYEVGHNGDFKTLDQTLRRVVMQAYEDKTPDSFDKVEAARLENVLANIREVIVNKHAIAGLNPNTVGEYVKFSDGKLVISDYDKFNRDVFKPLLERATEKIDQDSPIIKYTQATGEGAWQQMLADKYGIKESIVESNFYNQKIETPPEATATEAISKDTSVLEKQMIEKAPQESIGISEATNLNHTASVLHEKYNFPRHLADAISRYEKDFNITGLTENGNITPGSKFDVLVNLLNGERSILLTDAKGNLDTNQLVIFNSLVENSNNPKAILSALDITRSLNWTPDGELKLAQALVNPDRPALWQALLGRDIAPDNIKVKIDGTKLSLHKIGGLQGSLMIDFATKKVSVGRLLGLDGWKTDSARFFGYTPNEDTFEGALSKALNVVRQAKK